MRKVIALLGLSLALTGCFDKTIDGSSEEAMKASVREIQKSLSPEKQEEFKRALAAIALGSVDFKQMMADAFSGKAPAKTKDQMQSEMMASLDGKTAEEVIGEAKAMAEKKRQ